MQDSKTKKIYVISNDFCSKKLNDMNILYTLLNLFLGFDCLNCTGRLYNDFNFSLPHTANFSCLKFSD